jgi:O-antigen ligase/tetratricopeptide (TPR) repeat protein
MLIVALSATALVLAAVGVRGRLLHNRALLIFLLGLGAVMLLQLVPLPSGLVRFFSARRVELAAESSSALGAPAPAYLSLTASTKQTRDALLLYAGCFAVFVTTGLVFRRARLLRLFYAALAVSGMFMSLYALIVYLDDGARLHGTYTNANRFASLLGMCLLCAVAWRGLAARVDRRVEAVIATVSAASCGLALVATLSRMGIASFSAAILLLTFLELRRKEEATHVADTRSRRLLGVGTSIAATALLASLLTSFDPVWQRYSVLFDNDLAGNDRAVCWGMTLNAVRDFPVFGSGAGSFQHVFPLYQEPGKLSGFWKYTHNDYLNALSDLGVVGLALVLAAAVLWYRSAWRMSHSASTTRRVTSWTGIGVVTFVALHSVADFVLKQPANALIFSAIAGVTVAALRGERSASSGSRTRIPFLAAAVCFLALIILLVPITAAGKAYPLPTAATPSSLDARVADAALEHDRYDIDLRYQAARLAAGAAADAAALAHALSTLTAGPVDQMIDARALYLTGVLMWKTGNPGADAAMRAAYRLARAYPSITRAAGTYFLRRYIESKGSHPYALDAAVDSLRMANRTAPAAGAVRTSFAMLESVGASDRLERVSPDIEWAVMLLADHHARSGRPAAGAHALETYYAAHEHDVSERFLRALATSRDRAGDVQGATLARILYVTRAPAENRMTQTASMVKELISQKRNAEASMFVRALERRYPSSPAAIRARAEFALSSRDYATAYQLLSKSVEQAGGPDDHYALAVVALKLRRDVEAERHLTLAIEARPSATQYWVLRAGIRQNAGELDLAIQDLRAALHAAPRNDRTRLRLGALLRQTKRIEEVVELWREAASARPKDPFVLEHLARALFASARFDEAVATARSAYRLAPKRASIKAFLGQIDPDGPASQTRP